MLGKLSFFVTMAGVVDASFLSGKVAGLVTAVACAAGIFFRSVGVAGFLMATLLTGLVAEVLVITGF